METQVPDTAARLSDLPTEVLGVICRSLTLKDRMRLSSTCRALWHGMASSKDAWGTLEFTAMTRKKTLSLLAWLTRRRQGLRRLELDFDGGALGCSTWQLQTQLAACLGGSPLVHLKLFRTTRGGEEGGAELQWLGSCTALTSLSLEKCVLRRLPGTLELLATLAELSLVDNSWLGGSSWGQLQQLTALTRLDISSCGLCSPPAELAALPALAELSLVRNGLGGASWELLWQLTALTRLDISSCGLISLPAELAALPALAELRLAENELGEADWGPLQQLTALTRLDISWCELAALPTELAALPALATLNLFSNGELGAAAEEGWAPLAECSGLTSLDLGAIIFSRLPSALAALAPHLVDLALLGTSEEGLWTGGEATLGPLLSLTGLTRLNLQGHLLEYGIPLPEELSRLAALQDLELIIYYNSKHHWELLRPLWRLTALTRLRLSGAVLSELPEELSHLQALKDLGLRIDLGACEDIGWQPLGRLTALTKLDLSGCRVKRLPPALAELRSLADLDLGRDYFLSWAESAAVVAANWAALEHLTALTRLDASDCDLDAVPAVFAALPRLQVLCLTDNPSLGRAGMEALRPLTRITALQHLDLHGCCLSRELEVDAIPFPLHRLEGWAERLEGLYYQNETELSRMARELRLSDSSDS